MTGSAARRQNASAWRSRALGWYRLGAAGRERGSGMKKKEFLKRLSAGMAELPLPERHKRIKKYRAQLEDRLRQGESEEEIIAAFPPPEKICREALEEIPERRKPLSAAQKAMLTAAAVLTSPLWIGAALIAAGAALVCYVLLWLSIAAVPPRHFPGCF